jgi:hypothetical protein
MARGGRNRRRRRSQAILYGPKDDSSPHERGITPDDWIPLMWIKNPSMRNLIGSTDDSLNAWKQLWMELESG